MTATAPGHQSQTLSHRRWWGVGLWIVGRFGLRTGPRALYLVCCNTRDILKRRRGSQKPGSGPGVTLNPLINPPFRPMSATKCRGRTELLLRRPREFFQPLLGGVDFTCLPAVLSIDVLAPNNNQAGAYICGRDEGVSRPAIRSPCLVPATDRSRQLAHALTRRPPLPRAGNSSCDVRERIYCTGDCRQTWDETRQAGRSRGRL